MKSIQEQVANNCRYLLLIIIILLVVNLSGCGFYLAGSSNLPPQLVSLQLLTDDLTNSQISLLGRQLKQAGANLEKNQNDAVRLKVVIEALPERKLVDTAGSGKTIVRLFRQLNYNLTAANGDYLAEQKTILRQIDVERDSDDIAGLEYEKQSAAKSLDRELVEQLIFQLKHFKN
jgi:outer membrane lipopolysaccharide assembly protein LptE/RlpB